jgi:type IX secretion system PorP/SprF family membrane protein
MKNVRLILTIMKTLIVCGFVWSQDPIYSQFFTAPMQMNPALAGNTVKPRVGFHYRNQWIGIPNAFSTYSATYDQYFKEANSGLGFTVQGDQAGNGLLSTYNALANYSYRLGVNDDFSVKFGVEAGVGQSRINWDKLIFLDQLDPLTGPVSPGGVPGSTREIRPNELNKTYLDLGAGLVAFTDKFFGGLSLKHLNNPNNGIISRGANSKDGLPLRMTIHGGGQFLLRERNRIQPAVVLYPQVMWLRQGAFNQLNLGAHVNYMSILLGTYYRQTSNNGDAIIGMVGWEKSIFRIGYSYDFTISKFAQANGGGAHELSLILNFGREDDDKVDYNDCFGLFR